MLTLLEGATWHFIVLLQLGLLFTRKKKIQYLLQSYCDREKGPSHHFELTSQWALVQFQRNSKTRSSTIQIFLTQGICYLLDLHHCPWISFWKKKFVPPSYPIHPLHISQAQLWKSRDVKVGTCLWSSKVLCRGPPESHAQGYTPEVPTLYQA